MQDTQKDQFSSLSEDYFLSRNVESSNNSVFVRWLVVKVMFVNNRAKKKIKRSRDQKIDVQKNKGSQTQSSNVSDEIYI